MRGEQEYALMPYLSYAIVPLHPLFAATGNPKVERPQADWEVRLWVRPGELFIDLRLIVLRKEEDERANFEDAILVYLVSSWTTDARIQTSSESEGVADGVRPVNQ
jgi:hypothetical protein